MRAVYGQLYGQGVDLPGTLLKPNMVLSGKECPDQASVDEVAAATIECLRQAVPASVPGIVFLSGGQSSELATAHLNAMNALGDQPWELSFSYGRALQEHALKAWGGAGGGGGNAENASAAQQALRHRAECNGAARSGSYTEAMEAAV